MNDAECYYCKVPKATNGCDHIIEFAGQVTMAYRAWVELCNELHKLRNQRQDILDLLSESPAEEISDWKASTWR